MNNWFFATSRCLFARRLPVLHTGRTLNLFVLDTSPIKFVKRLITHTTKDHTTSDHTTLGSFMFFFFLKHERIHLYEGMLTIGWTMTSSAISFTSIKSIVSSMSFSLRLPHPSTCEYHHLPVQLPVHHLQQCG